MALTVELLCGHPSDPAGYSLREPRLDFGRHAEDGEALQHAAHVRGDDVSPWRRPFLALPIEAAARDSAERVHDVRLIREGEDDDLVAVAVLPEFDVEGGVGEAHRSLGG